MKNLERRVAKLEAANKRSPTGDMSPDDLRRWVERLEEFPAELLDGVEGDRIAEIRAVCSAVGMRVRAGELRTIRDIAHELPTEALEGMAAQRKQIAST